MQTFLPYPAFEDVATVLDYRRLGKQRVEGYQILNILAKPPDYRGAWINHPAVKMWRGYEMALKLYVNMMILEWVKRGFRNNMCLYEISRDELRFPWWLGDPRLHDSHKSNLLRKDYHYYSQFHWNVPPDLPYFWPVT
jgi:hypothetical protein